MIGVEDRSSDALAEIQALKDALASACAERQTAVMRAEAAMAEAAIAIAQAAVAKAERADDQAQILHLQLQIEKLRRQLQGRKSEHGRLLLDQMELALEELQAGATEDELAAERAAAKTSTVTAFTRRRPVRKPFPDRLPRERILLAGPTQCCACGSERLRKLSETKTDVLEVVPRTWKVLEYVREKFTCRDCQSISQEPAPFHVAARAWAGPSFLAMIAFEKFAQGQPLNRQAERFAKEGVPLSLSTLADQIGVVCDATRPIYELIMAHVFAAERVHGDDTHVKTLAKGQCITARIWDYIRDDRPFGGTDPPAGVFFYSRTRQGLHPQEHLAGYSGILQADAFSGYTKLFEADRKPGLILEAACWAHSRRKFFELADIAASARRKAEGKKPKFISPMALEAVQRIDALFAIEREIHGKSADERRTVRQLRSAPLLAELKTWMTTGRAKLSGSNDVAKAMDYMLTRWDSFARFIDDGRICMTNNAAERGIRGLALGRKAWLFCGSDRGGERAARMMTLFVTCKLNDVDGQAWLADVLARIADHPARRLHELLPWNWKAEQLKASEAATQAA